jgi:tetratricopeptide (TPR) repeat protein
MKSRPTVISWPVPGSPSVVVVFFVLFFLYVWLRVEPSLEFQHSGPVFLLNHSFFKPFLTYPGGLVDYGTAFLAQLNYDNWLGALVFTMIGFLVFLATRKVLNRVSGVTSQVVPYGAPFLLLLLRDRYDSPSLAISLGLLLSISLAMGYVTLPWTGVWLRLAACWVTSALLIYVAGVWPCLLFVVLGSLFEVVRRRKWLLGLGCVLSALVAPLGMFCFTDANVAKVLKPWSNTMPGIFPAVVYLSFSLAAVVLALLPHAHAPKEGVPPARGGPSKAVPARRWFQAERARRAFALSLLLLGWAAVWLVFDARRKPLAQIDYYASRREYEKVLAAAAQLKAIDAASGVRLHLALYHTGRLGRDLFSFTNQTVWDLMPALAEGLEACRPQSETLLELGQVNLAEHFAHEALECEGERPDLLERLARINILKDRPKAARAFLNVLGQVPFHREWAGTCLRDLEANPRLPDNQELAQIRSRMVSIDLPHSTLPTESILRQLLQSNRRNQMAFEYLMAHYLLTRQVDRIVEEIGRLNDFEYADIPRHYEEALLLYQQAKQSAKVDLQGRQIRPATLRRFQEFSAAIKRRALDSAEGRQALTRDFGDTFWYHLVSGRPTIDQSADRPTQQ